jgi:hypothetical protein
MHIDYVIHAFGAEFVGRAAGVVTRIQAVAASVRTMAEGWPIVLSKFFIGNSRISQI